MKWQLIIKIIYVSCVKNSYVVLSQKIGRTQKALYSVKFIVRQLSFCNLRYRKEHFIRFYFVLGHINNKLQYSSPQSLETYKSPFSRSKNFIDNSHT